MAQTPVIQRTDSLFEELARVQTQIMQRANQIFRENGEAGGREIDDWLKAEQQLVWRPDIELSEKDGQFLIEIAAPGVNPKDIVIEVSAEDILVKANLTHRHKTDEKGEVHICEFSRGNLFRGIHLPKPISTDTVKAEFKNGMLTIKAAISANNRVKKAAAGTAK